MTVAEARERYHAAERWVRQCERLAVRGDSLSLSRLTNAELRLREAEQAYEAAEAAQIAEERAADYRYVVDRLLAGEPA